MIPILVLGSIPIVSALRTSNSFQALLSSHLALQGNESCILAVESLPNPTEL
jgi:hypothetical protein